MPRGRKKDEHQPLPPEVDVLRIVQLREAAKLSGLNPRTLARLHRDKLILIGARRLGMRVGDAIRLRLKDAP